MRIDSDLNPQLQSQIFASLLLHMKAERRRAPYASSDAGKRPTPWDGLAKDLLRLGLSKTAADTLVSWATTQSEQSRSTPAKIRILHPMEREFISVDAYDYLLELYRLGVIGPPQLEMLIENCAFLTSLPATREQVARLSLRAFAENLEAQGLGSSH